MLGLLHCNNLMELQVFVTSALDQETFKKQVCLFEAFQIEDFSGACNMPFYVFIHFCHTREKRKKFRTVS